MRGRKPKPTHLKLITGNPGRRPLNQQEPVPVADLPDAPAELSIEARGEWDRVAKELHRAGIVTYIDRSVLAAYCQAFGRWIVAERTFKSVAASDPQFHGMLVKTAKNNTINNPLIGIANTAMRDMVRYASELGMTPSARSRIRAEHEIAGNDPAQKYFTS